MKKMAKVAAFICGLWLLGVLPAQALQIVYPADKTSVHRSDFLILKGGDQPQLDGMSIAINGAKSDVIDISAPEYRAVFKDFLILQPDFDSGKNAITVEGYAGGKKVAQATADIWFVDEPDGIAPDGYQPFVMHIPEREKLCTGCHNMDPTPGLMSAPTTKDNPCAGCHKRMLNKKFVHGPAGVNRCSYCHNPESRPAKYQPRKTGADLCNECHQEKVDEFKSNKFVHGPVAVGLCSVCHDSHASDYRAQSLMPINDLCLNCHSAIRDTPHVVRGIRGEEHPLKGVPDPSNPGRELACTSCHNPHGGKSKYFFVRGLSGSFRLCSLCHQK